MSKLARSPAITAVQKAVGQRMKWVRELVEPNRSKVADWFGTDPSTLAKIEDGTRASSIFLVICYANRFDVPTDFILRGNLSGIELNMQHKLVAYYPEIVVGQAPLGLNADDMASGAYKSTKPMTPARHPGRRLDKSHS